MAANQGGRGMSSSYLVHSEAETWEVAKQLADSLTGGMVVALHGELGSGKTTFTQGLCHALGVKIPITSPTFALVAEYQGAHLYIVHLDLYRLQGVDEVLALGFNEYLERGALVVVEWPENAGEVMPSNAIHIYISMGEGYTERKITVNKKGLET